MSQCYHVELKASVSRVVKGEDSVSYPIELTRILPEEEMVEILAGQLEESGWKLRQGGGRVFERAGDHGETLTIDLESMELTASLSSEREVTAEATVYEVAEDRKHAEGIAKARLKEEEAALGDQLEDRGNSELQNEVTTRLAESEAERQRMMNEILQQVYAESLKRKAGQLGDVMEVSESMGEDGNYELTIRIEQ